jgi:PAS domain S-box-containing protein
LEDNLHKAQQSLEEKVEVWTAELKAANAELKQEIMTRKQTENELRDTTNFLNNLIESSGDCIIIADPSGCLTRANNYFLQMLGYEREEEVIGKHITDFGPTEGTNYESVTGEEVYLSKQYFKDRKTMYEKFKKDGRISNWQVDLVTK